MLEVSPEIWHGVIRPQPLDQEDIAETYKRYFRKLFQWYEQQGVYALSSQEAAVLYMDHMRESRAVTPALYGMYQSYQDHKEDILYHRYNTELVDNMLSESVEPIQEEVLEALQALDPSISSDVATQMDMDAAPDIQKKHIVDGASKTFFGTLG